MTFIRTAGKKVMRFVSALFLAALLLGGPAAAVRGEAPAQALRPVATVAFPQERQALESPELRASFPRLGNNFEVLGPSTRQFNCIAWSLGNTHEWVWPGKHLADFDALYGKYGYTRESGLNLAVEPGKRKLVLFATLNPDGTIKAATHAAVQVPDGSWTSKLGGMALIRHPTLEVLRGPSYGTPVAVYTRPANCPRQPRGPDDTFRRGLCSGAFACAWCSHPLASTAAPASVRLKESVPSPGPLARGLRPCLKLPPSTATRNCWRN